MRTIKFRGKTVNNGEWIEGNLLSINNHYEIGWQESSTYEAEGGWEQYEVQSNTIGQFTGLHDKNGKEIYEGDIVKISHDVWHQPVKIPLHSYGHQYDDCGMKTYYRNYVVNYYPGYSHCGFRLQNGSITHNLLGSLIAHDMEVVGNYYDNPELLKGGQE